MYVRFRTWLQPYWRPKPKKTRAKKPAEPQVVEIEEGLSEERSAGEGSTAIDPSVPLAHQARPIKPRYPKGVAPGETMDPREWSEAEGLTVLSYPHAMGEIWKNERLPKPMQVWYHHDDQVHELFSHLVPGSGFKFKERNRDARNRLKPLIMPRGQGKPFDRTHLIPIGYHGSEGDKRLLVGWDSAQNRGPMNDFEQRQKRRKVPIYWLARIKRTERGATLVYVTWDARNMNLLDSQEYSVVGEFVWKET